MIIYDPIPSISSRNNELPEALDLWWERAVARNRDERFQTAKELSDSFGEAIETTKQMAVPSIAPRAPLPSLNDGDADRPRAPRASYSPPTADQSARFSSPALFTDKTPVEDGTGAPVVRTRRSVLPELSSLPKKQRLIVLSVGGALLAVLAFLVIASLRSSSDTATVAASRPSAAPVMQVTPVGSGKLQPPPIIFGPDSLPLEQEDPEKKKKPPPVAPSTAPAARPAGPARDYGI
jgi:serine/threonine-protein kinase